MEKTKIIKEPDDICLLPSVPPYTSSPLRQRDGDMRVYSDKTTWFRRPFVKMAPFL